MTSEEIVYQETFQNPLCRFERVLATRDGYCIFELRFRDDEILLNNIRVSEDAISKGIGSEGLEWIKSVSERTGDMISGVVESNCHKTLSNKVLAKWYSKHNFVVNRISMSIKYFPECWYAFNKKNVKNRIANK